MGVVLPTEGISLSSGDPSTTFFGRPGSISSPIIWGDRVYLTTAVKGSESILSRKQLAWGSLVILVLALPVALFLLGSGLPVRRNISPLWYKSALWLDWLVVAGATFVFAVKLTELLFWTEAKFALGDLSGAWSSTAVKQYVSTIYFVVNCRAARLSVCSSRYCGGAPPPEVIWIKSLLSGLDSISGL